MPLYQEIFPAATLREDVRAAGKWKTKQNGIYYAAGVRSQIAGRGAHIALIDDAMSEEDAFSEAGRRYIKEWYPFWSQNQTDAQWLCHHHQHPVPRR